MVLRYRTGTRLARASSTRAAATEAAADAFLTGEVGLQKNGMTLSVLSMLCRQGFDPWNEVKHLSGLARGEAAVRLTTHIRNAPLEVPSMCKASALASDLLSLLPAFHKDPDSGAGVRVTPATGQAVSQGPATQPSTHHMNYARLLIALIACVILIIIGIVDPKSIVSSTATVTTGAVTTATAPAASGQPRL